MSAALWFRILCVAAGGAAGALCRWGLAALVMRLSSERVSAWRPGTLVVNVLGCFCFGVVVQILMNRAAATAGPHQQDAWRLALLVGFMGAFTTFSTFAFDTQDIYARAGPLAAAGNIMLHVALGWAALLAGLAAARLW